MTVSVMGWRSGARLVLWLLVLLIGRGPSPAAAAGPEIRIRTIDTPVELSVSASGSERPAGVGCSRLNPDETTGAPCVAVLTVPSTDAASISANSHESTCYVYDTSVVVRVGGADNDSPAGPVVHVGVGSEWSVALRSAAAGTRTTRFATFVATNHGERAYDWRKLGAREFENFFGESAEAVKKEIVGSGGSKFDLYEDKCTGEIFVLRKGGIGEPQLTGYRFPK
jgi:hypothetical protein